MPKGSIELIDAAEAGKKRSNYDTDGDGKVSAAEIRAAADKAAAPPPAP